MDHLLTPSITRSTRTSHGINLVSENHGRAKDAEEPKPTCPEDILGLLRDEPGYESLVSALRYLNRHQSNGSDGFNIRRPSPLSAQLVQVLVSEIAPNYWALLKEDTSDRRSSSLNLFLSCLRSVAGINSVLIRLKTLIQDARSEQGGGVRGRDVSLNISIFLDLLCRLLQGESCILDVWKATTAQLETRGKLRPLTQELLTIFGSGRLVSVTAEAETLLDSASKQRTGDVWLANASQYTTWLGNNIAMAVSADEIPEQAKFVSGLFARALHLGHPNSIIKHLLSKLLLRKETKSDKLSALLDGLPQSEQRKVLFSILKIFAEDHLNRLANCESPVDRAVVSAIARAIELVVGPAAGSRRDHLVDWLTSPSGAGLGDGIGIRRAALAVISKERDRLGDVLERTMDQFGDQIYIKHSPILQQEAHAQVILLSAGYTYRLSPLKLTMLLKSGPWLNAISHRLAAPHLRARFLGMVVGEALSSMVNKGDKKLDFKMEDTESVEGKWYKSLVGISDEVGTIEPLLKPHADVSAPAPEQPRRAAAPVRKPASQLPKTGFVIEELSDDELTDDDVVAYGKPDSDEEDSDDDATLIRRDKPKAPVYIRDLIKYLRDTENYDHQKLAVTTAPVLIRRKADYGKEVAEHAEELASLLVGLQDKYDIENFDNLKLQGMIALAVAQPQMMGPWFSKTFFDGDYSVSQRASILVTLGLGSRELAGLETSEIATVAAFPSKSLPEKVERLFIGAAPTNSNLSSASSLKPLPPNALDNMARSITSDIIAPIAATAADAATGPDALKLSTFTSRLENTKGGSSKVKIKARSKPRVRIIQNTTASLLSTSFFSPLTARFQAALHSSAARTRGIIFQPYLLALYIKTLALLLHAGGPGTLALPQMTTELWGLLLNTGVRAQAVGDLGVTQAILFALLALLDVNEDRMRDVCKDLGREVVETQEWVAGVFGGLRGGDGGEEDQVKMMAAGVLVRLNEGIEKYRLLMVGDLIGHT